MTGDRETRGGAGEGRDGAGDIRGGDAGAAGRIDCRRVEEEDLVDRYVGGRLSDSEREAFEEHYFECDRCGSFVALATAVRRSIRELDEERAALAAGTSPAESDRPGGSRREPDRAGGSPAPAGPGSSSVPPDAADSARGERPVATAPAPAESRSLLERIPAALLFAVAATLILGFVGIRYLTVDGTDSQLRALSHPESLPPYVPAALRGEAPAEGGSPREAGDAGTGGDPGSAGDPRTGGEPGTETAGTAPDSATRLYLRGMEAYAAADVGRAADLLQRSVGLDATKPVRDFYLGVSLLAADRPERALAPLRRALGHPALAEEARLHLARAHLGALHPDSALLHLDALAGGAPPPLSGRARTLAARVRDVLEDP